MPFYVPIIVALVSIIVTALVTTYVRKTMIEKKVGNAEEKAREIIDDALKVAERSKREALLEAKEESLKTKNELERKQRNAERSCSVMSAGFWQKRKLLTRSQTRWKDGKQAMRPKKRSWRSKALS